MRLFTCEFNRMSDELLAKEYEIVRLGDPNVSQHELNELFQIYVKELFDNEFDPEEDIILLVGHFKRAAALFAAAKQMCNKEALLVIHYDNTAHEYSEEWIHAPFDVGEEEDE